MRSRAHATALVAGIVGFPLWLLSYAWLPFASAAQPAWVWPLVVAGEVGALAAGVTALVASVRARGAQDARVRRRAAVGGWLGGVVLVLTIGLNVFAAFVL